MSTGKAVNVVFVGQHCIWFCEVCIVEHCVSQHYGE